MKRPPGTAAVEGEAVGDIDDLVLIGGGLFALFVVWALWPRSCGRRR